MEGDEPVNPFRRSLKRNLWSQAPILVVFVLLIGLIVFVWRDGVSRDEQNCRTRQETFQQQEQKDLVLLELFQHLLALSARQTPEKPPTPEFIEFQRLVDEARTAIDQTYVVVDCDPGSDKFNQRQEETTP